jgi:hypothetical protein
LGGMNHGFKIQQQNIPISISGIRGGNET